MYDRKQCGPYDGFNPSLFDDISVAMMCGTAAEGKT
jgi:hypothetical protein